MNNLTLEPSFFLALAGVAGAALVAGFVAALLRSPARLALLVLAVALAWRWLT
jgi:hypothetical protein